MKNYFEVLNRELLLKAIKAVFWLLPVFLITDFWYVKKFNAYNYKLDSLSFIANYLRSYEAHYAIILFSLIFLVAYKFEKNIIPGFLTFINPKAKLSEKNKELLINTFDKLGGDKFNKDFVNAIKEKGIGSIYDRLSYRFVGFLLWAVYFAFINQLWFWLILILGIINICYKTYVVKFAITNMKDYQNLTTDKGNTGN